MKKYLNFIIEPGAPRVLFTIVSAYFLCVALYAAVNGALDQSLRTDRALAERQEALLAEVVRLKDRGDVRSLTDRVVTDRDQLANILLYGRPDQVRWEDARMSALLPFLNDPVVSKSQALEHMLGGCDPTATGTSCPAKTIALLSDPLEGALKPLRSHRAYVLRRYINGYIQFATVVMTVGGLILLLFHSLTAFRERRLIDEVEDRLELKGGDGEVRWRKLGEEAGQRLFKMPVNTLEKEQAAVTAELLENRARELLEFGRDSDVLRAARSVSLGFASSSMVQEARTALQQQEQSIRAELDSRQATLRYVAWAIPSLGFIGTVLGIGQALDDAYRVASATGGEKFIQEGAIQAITGKLSVAFDTTLVALVASLLLMLGINAVGRYEERIVDRLTHRLEILIQRMKGSALEKLLSDALQSKVDKVSVNVSEDTMMRVLRQHDHGRDAALIRHTKQED